MGAPPPRRARRPPRRRARRPPRRRARRPPPPCRATRVHHVDRLWTEPHGEPGHLPERRIAGHGHRNGIDASSPGAILECNNDPGQPTATLGAPISQAVPVSCTGVTSAGLITTTSSGTLSAKFTIASGTTGPPCGTSYLATTCPTTDSSGGNPTTDAAKYPCPPRPPSSRPVIRARCPSATPAGSRAPSRSPSSPPRHRSPPRRPRPRNSEQHHRDDYRGGRHQGCDHVGRDHRRDDRRQHSGLHRRRSGHVAHPPGWVAPARPRFPGDDPVLPPPRDGGHGGTRGREDVRGASSTRQEPPSAHPGACCSAQSGGVGRDQSSASSTSSTRAADGASAPPSASAADAPSASAPACADW